MFCFMIMRCKEKFKSCLYAPCYCSSRKHYFNINNISHNFSKSCYFRICKRYNCYDLYGFTFNENEGVYFIMKLNPPSFDSLSFNNNKFLFAKV